MISLAVKPVWVELKQLLADMTRLNREHARLPSPAMRPKNWWTDWECLLRCVDCKANVILRTSAIDAVRAAMVFLPVASYRFSTEVETRHHNSYKWLMIFCTSWGLSSMCFPLCAVTTSWLHRTCTFISTRLRLFIPLSSMTYYILTNTIFVSTFLLRFVKHMALKILQVLWQNPHSAC